MINKIGSIVFIALVTILLGFVYVPKIQAACSCLVWTCPADNYHCGDSPLYPDSCYTTCYCDECVPVTCGAGTYPCNRGCCEMGTTPTPGPDPSPGPGPDPSPSCSITAPANLVATMTSATSATLNWTPGAGGVYQAMWVSTNPEPQVGCAGSLGGTSVCPVRLDSSTVVLPTTTNTYSIDNLLTPGTVYYWKIMNYKSSTCYSDAWALFPCGLSPSSLTISQGQSRTIYSTIPSSLGIQNVTFSSSTSALTVDPASDSTYVYQTLVRAILQGSAVITSNVYNTGGILSCSSTAPVTILPPSPWWQVKDSDTQTAGDLMSGVPGLSTFFNLDGPGGFPGVTSYGGTTYLTTANVSSTGWLAGSPPIAQKSYDYAYFVNQISDDIIATINTVDTADVAASLTSGGATHDANNYYWYKYDGAANGDQALTIPAVNIGTRKIILLVDNADVNITDNINLTDGEGFFMLISERNINVDPLVGGGVVPNLEGIYIASNSFNTGLGNTQLWIRGSVTGNLGVNMQRDLGGVANSDPSEFFEYAPDLIMLYPSKLGIRKISWKEVAP